MQDEDMAQNTGTETSQPETPTGESEEQDQKLNEEVKTEEGKTSEERTSRAEQRIKDLTHKLKEATSEKQSSTTEYVPPFNYPTYGQEQELPINPATGEVDLDQLNRVVEQRAATIAELQTKRIISEIQKEAEYRQAVLDWASDLEKTIQESPELDPNSPQYNAKLDSALKEVIEKANFTEDGQLAPKLKVSAIWKNFKEALELEKSKAQGEVTVGLAKQIAEEAIRPSGEARKTYSTSDLRQLLTKDPAKVAAILESKLSVTED